MKNNIFKTIFIALIGVLLVSCTTSNEANKKKIAEIVSQNLIEITTDQFKYSNMELGAVSLYNFTERVKTNGFIDVPPADRAMVSAMMGGYVKISHLLIGENVKKGQLLLTLENPDFIEIQQKYLELYETLNFLKSEYTRQKTLFDEKITSQKNYLKAESEYKSSLARFNGLEQKLHLLNINPATVKTGKFTSTIPVYSPLNGTVASVNTSVGKFMNESDVLVEIINNDHKHIELVIFEKDILKVKESQKIIFNLPENSTKTYTGEVHLIGKTIDQINRTVKVHGHLENENESFLVGMFVEAEIITNSLEKWALPVSSILEEDASFFVLVLKNQDKNNFTFEKVPVNIGLKDEEWAEIIDSEMLFKGKKILIKGAFIPLSEDE